MDLIMILINGVGVVACIPTFIGAKNNRERRLAVCAFLWAINSLAQVIG
jgi:hypothetical protein